MKRPQQSWRGGGLVGISVKTQCMSHPFFSLLKLTSDFSVVKVWILLKIIRTLKSFWWVSVWSQSRESSEKISSHDSFYKNFHQPNLPWEREKIISSETSKKQMRIMVTHHHHNKVVTAETDKWLNSTSVFSHTYTSPSSWWEIHSCNSHLLLIHMKNHPAMCTFFPSSFDTARP